LKNLIKLIDTECFEELNKFGPNNTPSIDLIEKECSTEIENENKNISKSSFKLFKRSESKPKLNGDHKHSNLKKINQSPFKFLSNLFKRTASTDSQNINNNNINNNYEDQPNDVAGAFVDEVRAKVTFDDLNIESNKQNKENELNEGLLINNINNNNHISNGATS